MPTRWLSLARSMLLAAGACAERAPVIEDPRCLDERIGSVVLQERASVEPAPVSTPDVPGSGGICDGGSGIRLVVVDGLGPGVISYYRYLDAYDGSFLVIDGKCHFSAFDNAFPRLAEGTVSAETLAQLTADLKLGVLADLPSSKDTQIDHYHDTLLATPEHSLRCRDELCRDPDANAAIQQALRWMRELAAQGRPSTGPLRAFAFPDSGMHAPALVWPLAPTLRSLRSLIVFDDWPTGGLRLTGADAASLREVRRRAIEAIEPTRDNYEPATVGVSDCGQTYRLLLRDEVPAPLHGDLIRFLDQAWAKPVIPSCVVWSSSPDSVTPCPDDY
jgi:hypothetical protein